MSKASHPISKTIHFLYHTYHPHSFVNKKNSSILRVDPRWRGGAKKMAKKGEMHLEALKHLFVGQLLIIWYVFKALNMGITNTETDMV